MLWFHVCLFSKWTNSGSKYSKIWFMFWTNATSMLSRPQKKTICVVWSFFSPLLRDNQDLYCFWRMNRVQSQRSAWTISKHQSVTLQTITSLGLIASSLSKLVITLILWRRSDDKLFQSMTNVLFVSVCAHGHLCVCVLTRDLHSTGRLRGREDGESEKRALKTNRMKSLLEWLLRCFYEWDLSH